MRKKSGAIVILLLVLLLAAGCGMRGADPGPETPGAGDHLIYPASVAATLETVKFIHAGVAMVVDGQTFVIVSYGEKPTAGYEAAIVGIETAGGKAVVTAQLTEPGDRPAAQVITYPYAVEVLEGVYTEVEFRDAGGEYFPAVVGLKGPLQLRERSDNILVSVLETAPGRVYAAGIARVFEATVNYELLDGGGAVLQEGYVTAASGGPDWGWFEVEITDPPAEADALVLFQVSAEDGTKRDVVTLPLCLVF